MLQEIAQFNEQLTTFMKTKHYLLLLLALALMGCKSTTIRYGDVHITDRRFFLNTAATVTYEVGSNGVRRITFAGSSRGDSEALEAVARGAAEGAK